MQFEKPGKLTYDVASDQRMQTPEHQQLFQTHLKLYSMAKERMPNERPGSRKPFDPTQAPQYGRALQQLRLRSKGPGHLPPHTPSVRLPMPVVRPPVTS